MPAKKTKIAKTKAVRTKTAKAKTVKQSAGKASVAATEPPAESDGPPWVTGEKDYSLALIDGKVVARNPKGKPLASVPKWLKDGEVGQQLLTLKDWLGEHESQCREIVDTWMMRSLPVPLPVLASIWADPTWRGLLQNLVAAAVGSKGAVDQEQSGFLRDVDAKKGVGVVDLDGETQWLKTKAIALPHPILLEDLDDYRSLVVELNFEQAVDQLFRETWTPTKEQRDAKSIRDFNGGKFEALNHVLGLCRRLGYRVRGGSATCSIWEGGTLIEPRYWVGAESPDYETWTGELVFTDKREQSVAVKDVGPVAFSEGMRMAAAIYAKRVVEEEDNDD